MLALNPKRQKILRMLGTPCRLVFVHSLPSFRSLCLPLCSSLHLESTTRTGLRSSFGSELQNKSANLQHAIYDISDARGYYVAGWAVNGCPEGYVATLVKRFADLFCRGGSRVSLWLGLQATPPANRLGSRILLARCLCQRPSRERDKARCRASRPSTACPA